VDEYDHVAAEAERPNRLADHRDAWERLTPLLGVNGTVRARVEAFAADKQLSLESLIALGTRVRVDERGGVELAWGYQHNEAVTAVKFRPLGEKRRYALTPSVFLTPLIIGRRDSLDWIVAEGETDAARLFDLVGDTAAILVLPAGAKAFKQQWANAIPRGATVALAHDGDEAGDAGATNAAAIIGGRTVRLRPPDGYKDWCEWPGGRDDFLELAAAARRALKQFEFAPYSEFAAHQYPAAEPLLGEPGAIFLARGSLLMVYGADGSGKSTWTIDGLIHQAAGVDWLGIPVPRPVRFCVIENEGPPDLFQQKLAAKIAGWEGPDPTANIFVFAGPWGEFSFANPDARAALNAFCDEHAIDVVTANPTLGLGVAASGRPDETQQFVDWLTECGLKSERAFWLLHHENKAGQISGDWGRHPDTKVLLQQDGDRPRTKLTCDKTRWATLPSETMAKAVMLEWIVETQGYTVTELDTVGASDAELEERIADFLTEHPWSTTRAVWDGVSGTNERIRKLLEGDRFDCVGGPRGSMLWGLASEPDSTASAHPTRSPNQDPQTSMDTGND
jgi:AAA domain